MSKSYSVIIPAYNAEESIENCLVSVLEQTLAPIEILIIDDCSLDRTVEVVKLCQASFIAAGIKLEYIQLAHNSGPSIARNNGIGVAKGEYIAFLDADDVWRKDKLSQTTHLAL